MSYTFSGSNTANFSGSTATVTLSIGSTANPFVVVGVQSNGGLASPSLTVGGVSLTLAVEDTSQFVCIFYGQITGGLSGNQSVVLTQTGGAGVGSMALWYTTDNVALSTTGKVDGNNVSATLNVSAGNYLFAYARGGVAFTFSGSTESPAGDRGVVGANNNDECADWVIASNHTPFSVTANTSVSWNVVAAAFSVTASVASATSFISFSEW